VVADFGCGDAKIARSVASIVHSFDLVALNEHVTACDMAHVSHHHYFTPITSIHSCNTRLNKLYLSMQVNSQFGGRFLKFTGNQFLNRLQMILLTFLYLNYLKEDYGIY